MRLSARVDYALRAVAELAAAGGPAAGGTAAGGTAAGGTAAGGTAAGGTAAKGAGAGPRRPGGRGQGDRRLVTAEQVARAQGIPPKFLESILLQLRRGGIVQAQRGPEGGYTLARPAEQISLADVIRVIDGPLANVRGQRPEDLGYQGAARALQEVWIALRASERQILELVTVADVATGQLPDPITELTADPEVWV
ncbi:RrF2 family transcriptional regulator [Plantactinospora siamensis]|uniref:RrF2 family transcriptional regulator n=1 Tax=Plantactinospora siamensis TaxID=555372 RepID=A0ABV6NZC6_9ACTN